MSYPPPYYTDDDPAFAQRIMAEHGFALLIADGLVATHLPLIYKEEEAQGALYGHLARDNPICDLPDNAPALAVFSGPHGYVSATLYEAPAKNVPTWNYASVQVRGRLSRLPDDALPSHLEEVSQFYEGSNGWSVSDAASYVAAIQRAIVAVRLEVESLQAFRKMSGNKNPAIRKRIIDAARAGGEDAFAYEMETLS